jgi:hypothetical protein
MNSDRYRQLRGKIPLPAKTLTGGWCRKASSAETYYPFHTERMMRRLCIALALAMAATSADAQNDAWSRMVAESDSVGDTTPHWAPGRMLDCGPGVPIADSVQVAGGESKEFLFARRSLRTRGMFSYLDPPAGAGRFELRAIYCHEPGGHPFSFILERDHRYFYLVYSLTERPTYADVLFRSPAGEWRPYFWDASARTLGPGPDPATGAQHGTDPPLD